MEVKFGMFHKANNKFIMFYNATNKLFSESCPGFVIYLLAFTLGLVNVIPHLPHAMVWSQ